MDTRAVQVDTWVTIAEAAKLLGRSEKTIRRWIAAGDLDKEAVRREETVGGFRYMLRRADVEKLVGAKARTDAGDLDSTGAALSTRLDTQAAQLERIASLLQVQTESLTGQMVGHVQATEARLTARLDQVDSNAVQARTAQTAQMAELAQTLTEALGAAQAAADAREAALLAEVRELRAELQVERRETEGRRGWWARLFGSQNGGDRDGR